MADFCSYASGQYQPVDIAHIYDGDVFKTRSLDVTFRCSSKSAAARG